MITAAIVSLLIVALQKLIQRILFAIGSGMCWVIGFLNDIFEMVAGIQKVSYKGSGMVEQKLLIKVFMGNTTVNTIYWGMALIGIVMCFGFTIVAVIRKSGDMDDKVKQSMGGILKNGFKGIVIILLMNFIISATISITSTLMDRINYLMLNAHNFDLSYDVTFDSEDYALMGRSLKTIGNYSINASYNSRYNINSCYNDIREDLETLGEKGKFDVTYISKTYDENGDEHTVNTWQSVLQTIYRSVDDISVDQPLDEYNVKLSNAILDAMDIIKNDASFEALEKYHVTQTGGGAGETVSLDRMIMLIGSLYGKGGSLSKGSGMTDYLRGPYYYGQKDIFDYDTVSDDFDMSIGTWLYLTVIVVAFLFIKEMLAMVFNAVARIFNMMLLYISAPPIIAVTPLDDGGKLKQWMTAFIIQSLGLFGTVISLRLIMIFLPILFSGDIQFFDSARSDIIARIIIMYGAIYTTRKASGMIVGILADNAGMQAINAGDVGSEARGLVDQGLSLAKDAGGLAWDAVKFDWTAGNWIKDKFSGGGGGGDGKGAKGSTTVPDGSNQIESGSKTNAQKPNNPPESKKNLGNQNESEKKKITKPNIESNTDSTGSNTDSTPPNKQNPHSSNIDHTTSSGTSSTDSTPPNKPIPPSSNINHTPNGGTYERGPSGAAKDYEQSGMELTDDKREPLPERRQADDFNLSSSSRPSLDNDGSVGNKMPPRSLGDQFKRTISDK